MISIYANFLHRRKLSFFLQKIIRLKTITLVFVFIFTTDFILSKIFGRNYKELYPPLFWINTTLIFYVIIGFAAHFSYAIEKSKRYYLIGWLVLFFAASYSIGMFVLDKFPSWTFLLKILATLLVTTFTSGIILLLLQMIKIRKSHAISLFHKIRLHKLAFGINILFLVLIILLVYYGNTKIQKLNNRLEKIETRLGGPEKIGCNEKDTINKIRQSVVRIVGGESEGSGFAIQSGGIILTNFHVIEFEPSPKVILPDNTFQTAEILTVDKNADLAIIKIDKELPVISWGDPKELDPAEELLAVGFPMGGDLGGEASVNKGSLAGRRRSKDVGVEYLQTDITFTGGVSGGPMVNVCGEVEGINTSGLAGLGFAISADSIKQKWLEMSTSTDSLKDIKRITFDDTTSAEFAVATFYNYLKVRKLEKAFELLSDNFKKGHSFNYWKQGYEPLLDTTVLKIEEDRDKNDRINIKLSTKDMVDDEIVYKYFEGYWDVKNIDGKWRLWEPKIKEVENPDYLWFWE